MYDLGNTIMRLRKERGLTQEQLAKELGISYQAVSKWETGNSCPDISTLPLLADLFCVSIDELFGRPARAPAAPREPEEAEPQIGAGLPWPDDESFYAVLYHGHELIVSTGEDRPRFHFQYEGPAQDVNCAFDLEVTGQVYGDVNADGDVTCDDVAGSVSANGSVTCDDVAGNVNAGGSVTCDDVTGNVNAGGSVTCDEIAGSAFAGGGISGDELHFESGWDSSGLEETLSGLGEKISEAVEKAKRKGWSFHRAWPFGEGRLRVDLDLEEDEEE